MDLLNQELQLIDENYPLSMPPWAILGFQLVSGGFILTEISMMTWLCVKHRKSIPVLLKFGFSLARKIHQNPSIIEHLIQQAYEFLHKTPPLDPPPQLKPKPPHETPVPTVSTSGPGFSKQHPSPTSFTWSYYYDDTSEDFRLYYGSSPRIICKRSTKG